MAEFIYFIPSCTDILPIFIFDSFADYNYNGIIFIKLTLNIINKLIDWKRNFGKINKVRCNAVTVTGKSRSGSKPTGISAHCFDNMNTFYTVNTCIVCYIFHGKRNILCGRAKSWRMVNSYKVIINCFRNTYNFNINVMTYGIFWKFINSIHWIITADIKKITNIIFFKHIYNLWICFFIIVKLISARAKEHCRC